MSLQATSQNNHAIAGWLYCRAAMVNGNVPTILDHCASKSTTVSFSCVQSNTIDWLPMLYTMDYEYLFQMDKVEKKIQRKKQRIFALLSKQGEVNITVHPTKTVLVGNAGLTTGASRESVLERFLPHARPRCVHMVPERQFCFVEFDDVRSAQAAVVALDGRCGEPVWYLAYSEGVPEVMRCLPAATSLPPDATLMEDLLDEAEEQHILDQLIWGEDGNLKQRQVQHFGYEFDYSTNNVDSCRPLPVDVPAWCDPLVDRLMARGLLAERPDQLTVNRYLPGQGIPPHVDTHSAFTGQLVSISLGAATTMEFSRPPPGGATAAVRLPRRSALVMDGEARYLWSHGITARKSDVTRTPCGELTLTPRATRVSLTLRRLRRAACRCRYPQQCDSQRAAGPAEPDLPERLERTYVAQVYENIADHFSCTRHKPWPRVESFVRSLPPGSVLLDIGCGNGKYLGLNRHLFEVGVDQSRRLCGIGRSRGHQTVAAGCLPLPVRSGAADACLCIAVIHHLATRERRTSALSELGRALRPGGRALVYVWALEQRLGARPAGYLKPGRRRDADAAADAALPLPVHTNRTEFRQQDMLVPWKLRGGEEALPASVHHRYYHLYRRDELEEDARRAGGLALRESYYDQGNWCVLLERTADGGCAPGGTGRSQRCQPDDS